MIPKLLVIDLYKDSLLQQQTIPQIITAKKGNLQNIFTITITTRKKIPVMRCGRKEKEIPLTIILSN